MDNLTIMNECIEMYEDYFEDEYFKKFEKDEPDIEDYMTYYEREEYLG